MSRRITQRRRRARRKGRRPKALALATRRHPRLRVTIGPLEIARGHDGFLRGYPEPVVVLATYALETARSRLLSRAVVRYEPVLELPCVLAAREPHDRVGVRLAPGTTVAVVAIGVEEDSSRDLQRLYAELADGDAVIAWPNDAIPGTLEQLREVLRPEIAAELQLQVAGQLPAAWFSRDDYVGAAGTWLEVAGRRSVELEIPLRSEDGRNDWRALVTVRFR